MSAPTLRGFAPDWSQFDPGAYLREYYGDLGAENLALLRFFAEVCQALPRGSVMLDFGGGPTVYPLISAVTRADEIHFTDFLGANLAEVERWLSGDPGAFDWSPFIRKALELESGAPCSDADVARRAQDIRARVTRLDRCDASRTPPIESLSHVPYDVVLTNFCAESATADRGQWHSYMCNITSLIRPGGWLVMSALEGATHYSVGSRSFPAVDLSQEDLLELLEESGFARKGIEMRSIPADRSTRDYKGLILAVARKGPGRGVR